MIHIDVAGSLELSDVSKLLRFVADPSDMPDKLCEWACGSDLPVKKEVLTVEKEALTVEKVLFCPDESSESVSDEDLDQFFTA